MKDMARAPGRAESPARKYSSASIRDRRARIAAATRRLIVDKGIDGFTMGEVSARAGVSEKTLYNIVGNRNRLVAQAVEHYQEELGKLNFLARDHDLDDVLNSLAAVSTRLVAEREWGRAIAHLYFSAASDPATHASLTAVSEAHLGPCIRLFARRGQLLPQAPLDMVGRHFANTAFGLVHDWTLARIADEDLGRHIAFALLAALSLLVSDDARRQLRDRMAVLATRPGAG